MKLGYVRTAETDPAHLKEVQMQGLREIGVLEQNIYVECRTGMAGRRPSFDIMMSNIGPGDELIVWTLDRVARSIEQLVTLVAELQRRGAHFRTLGEGQENIDTSFNSGDSGSKFFGLLDRCSRAINLEKITHNSKRRAPDRSKKPPLLLDWKEVECAQSVIRSRAKSVQALCIDLGVSPPTLYSYVGPSGELRERGRRALSAKPSQPEMPVEETRVPRLG